MKAVKILLALVCAAITVFAARNLGGMVLFLMDSTTGRTAYNFGALAGMAVMLILFGACTLMLARSAVSGDSRRSGGKAT